MDGAYGVDLVRFGGRLVVAIAKDTRETERHLARVARRGLHAVERDLDDLLGAELHHVAIGRSLRELEEAASLPFEHRVGHAFEGLAQHDETARGITGPHVDVRELALAPARAP